ncbi:MAG: restriction endonuclease subunit S [Bacteroidia bacterium]|nr:restriction endonuclease subunit S [Bacteroidia bacterium]
METMTQKIDLKNLDKSGWQTFRFEEIASKISETVDPNSTTLETYVGLEHLDAEDIHIRRKGTPDDVSGGKLKCYPGDVIFGKRRAYQRKAAIVDFEGICSAHAFVFRANSEVIDPQLFPFFLHSDQFMHRMVDISVGGLSPTINWGDLKHQEFLLPPKDQQAQLAELLWAMDEVVEASQEIKVKCEILIKSYSYQFFESRNERKVPFETTGDWKSGGTPSKKNNGYWSGDIPWVSPKDMKSEYIEDSIDKITLEGANSGSKIIPPNSILIVVRGMILLHSFPVAITGKNVAFNQDMKALLPSTDFLPKTLFYFLKKKSSEILSLSSESSHGTKSIPSEVLFGMQIPLIPKEDQIVFVKKIEVIEASITDAIGRLETSRALQKSLINQIF